MSYTVRKKNVTIDAKNSNNNFTDKSEKFRVFTVSYSGFLDGYFHFFPLILSLISMLYIQMPVISVIELVPSKKTHLF
jgi:hypothetical protein